MGDVVGLLHPGEMGAAIGAVLRQRGLDVLWASEGRSEATRTRAVRAGLTDAGTVEELAARSGIILSVCPPHAAADVAARLAPPSALGGRGVARLAHLAEPDQSQQVFVDANAIAPATARRIAEALPGFVDGGIVGGPPSDMDGPRLYLSGGDTGRIVELFAGTPVETRVMSGRVGDASALKMVYAAWSKGTAALVLTIREVALSEGVADELFEEWRESIPGLDARLASAERSATAKGWRWVAEMEEIAATFAAAGEPDGFHRAAAEVFRRRPRP